MDLSALPPFHPVPITLTGTATLLRPLVASDAAALAEACPPPTTRWFPTPLDTQASWDVAIAAVGTDVAFAIIARDTGAVCGTTRYMAIERAHRRLEIGWSVVGPAWQGRGINSEAKRLLLAHAFDDLGAIRVEFKTDSLNVQSRAALAAIGAAEEGTFRNHMIVAGGRIRHSVYFAIARERWPEVATHLLTRRDQQRAAFANA